MNVGITGHRKLVDPTDWGWVSETMARELDALPMPLVAVTCLAIGADQMLASQAVARGARVHAILPFADYDRTFTAPERLVYRRLLARAETEILQTPGTEEDAYQVAGYAVVMRSDLLLAVWDGLPALGKGGTGDVVAYALRGKIPLIHLNPLTHVVTRHGSPTAKV